MFCTQKGHFSWMGLGLGEMYSSEKAMLGCGHYGAGGEGLQQREIIFLDINNFKYVRKGFIKKKLY